MLDLNDPVDLSSGHVAGEYKIKQTLKAREISSLVMRATQ